MIKKKIYHIYEFQGIHFQHFRVFRDQPESLGEGEYRCDFLTDLAHGTQNQPQVPNP